MKLANLKLSKKLCARGQWWLRKQPSAFRAYQACNRPGWLLWVILCLLEKGRNFDSSAGHIVEILTSDYAGNHRFGFTSDHVDVEACEYLRRAYPWKKIKPLLEEYERIMRHA